MDCRTARLLLPYARPTAELPGDDAERLRLHLESCASCREAAQQDQAFDGALARAMRDVEIPDGLRERVGVGLAQQRGRMIQRRAAQIAALAAALLLVVSVPLVRWSSRVVVNAELLAQDEDQQFVLTFNGNVESAGEFFRSRGLRTQLPSDLNYALLTNLEVVSLRGQRAARLDFQSGEFRMKLYVLPRRDFRMPRDATAVFTSSHATVDVVEASSDYLLVFVCYDRANRQMFVPRAVVG